MHASSSISFARESPRNITSEQTCIASDLRVLGCFPLEGGESRIGKHAQRNYYMSQYLHCEEDG